MYGESSSMSGAGLIDSHLIAATRLLLAISALLIIDYASVPHFDISGTRSVVLLYLAYSAAIYVFVALRKRPHRTVPIWSCWADIGWYSLMLALSGGANSIFFFGFFFAILLASFEWGFRAGLLATGVSILSFITVSLAAGLEQSNLELRRFLMRLVYLLVLGYLIARWGGLKIKSLRQIKLLNEITTVSPPRLGVDHLIDSTIEQLRAFYDADTALIVAAGSATLEYSLHRVKRSNAATPAQAEPIPPEMLQVMLTLPADYAVVYCEGFTGRRRLDYAYDLTKLEAVAGVGDTRTLTALLDAKSLITVPLRHQNYTLGRLYLTSQRRRDFDISDVHFLIQVTDHVVPIINSIRLVDRLAAEAAEEERQRIARDIHDSIIQPYIGLQMGLFGIRQKLAGARDDTHTEIERVQEMISDATADTDRLIEMTSDGISDLRGYVHGLREAVGGEDSLMPSVRRFASKFSQATNILVQVRADTDIHLDDRLATEIFQMVVEGLSNIRRHTESARAFIGLDCSGSRLRLRIENDGKKGAVPTSFTPRSIAERAQSLGGRAYVEIFGDMGTSVIVEIPV
jgi:signal transduction histidine kinase